MTELWSWRVDDRVAPVEVYSALADILDLPVMPLGAADPARFAIEALLCDVWRGPGDYPIAVDCYGPPSGITETNAVAAFARRLRRHCLLPDDTFDPGRHLLVAPDGTTRPVHLDVLETDDGVLLSNQRLCTTLSPGCRGWSQCHQSRWAPDSVVPALAAA